eukprot:1161257-Pelagomonas_calceolata.AAC.2
MSMSQASVLVIIFFFLKNCFNAASGVSCNKRPGQDHGLKQEPVMGVNYQGMDCFQREEGLCMPLSCMHREKVALRPHHDRSQELAQGSCYTTHFGVTLTFQGYAVQLLLMVVSALRSSSSKMQSELLVKIFDCQRPRLEFAKIKLRLKDV